MKNRENKLVLCVATLTRRRPEMLSQLIKSWSELKLPINCEVSFLVVENDDKEYSQSLVAEHEGYFSTSELAYAFEPELGIPFGRNRAARVAIERGADLLLFVDDDEVVDPTWLERMLAGYRSSNARLMGAPLRAKPPKDNLSFFQRKLYQGIEARYAKKEMRARQRATLNSTKGVTIVTNNWIAETALFKDHNIWFDENMRFTGGTDTKFYSHVVAAGFVTGWVADAYVYETISPERLSFSYQYKRARDQSNTQIRRKHEAKNTPSLFAIGGVLVKTLPCIALVCLIPFTNYRTALPAARSLGWIAGRLGYLFGKKSSLYAQVTGA